VGRSGDFAGYVAFVDEIRTNSRTMGIESAITEAIQKCIGENILRDFLQTHSSEVFNMLLTEWNWEDAKEVWQEEAREEGIERGIRRTALNLKKVGMPVEKIAEVTGLSPDDIRQL
jgi:predicted transposase/invertase (TIGR01784 family)